MFLTMSEHIGPAFNLKFVAEVEKFPVLYNYKLKSHSRKDVIENAWSDIAKEVGLSVRECKEKWRNLRSVFVRHLKPVESGSNKKKPYYLFEAMKFTLPFIRLTGVPEGSLSEVANEPVSTPAMTQHISDDSSNYVYLTDDEGQDTTSLSPPSPTDVHIPNNSELPQTKPTNASITKKKRKFNTLTDFENSLKGLIDAETEKIASENLEDPQGKKLFLLSLVPELEPLTDDEMRLFRRRVLLLIDNIRGIRTL